MSKIFLLLFLLISVFCQNFEDLQFEEEDPNENMTYPNVYNLDDSNFTQVLKKYEQAYVLIYASWCTHCHLLLPIFNETANYFKEENINVTFFKIEGSKNQNASVDFVVQAFPRIFFINKGERYKFQGPRTKEGMLYFRERKLVNDFFPIQKLDEIKNIKNIFETNLTILSTLKNKTTKIYQSLTEFAEKAISMKKKILIKKIMAISKMLNIIRFKISLLFFLLKLEYLLHNMILIYGLNMIRKLFFI